MAPHIYDCHNRQLIIDTMSFASGKDEARQTDRTILQITSFKQKAFPIHTKEEEMLFPFFYVKITISLLPDEQ